MEDTNAEKNPEETTGELGDTPEEGKDETPETSEAADGAIKVVITVKGTKATVGVQSEDADPVFGMVEGNRDEIMQGALRILSEAEEKWKTTLHYPKTSMKPVATPVRSAAGSKSQPSKPKTQEALF